MPTNIIRSISLGLKRRSRRGLTAGLSAVGTIWLLTEVGTSASAELKAIFDSHHAIYLVLVGLAALVTFLWYIHEPQSVSF